MELAYIVEGRHFASLTLAKAYAEAIAADQERLIRIYRGPDEIVDFAIDIPANKAQPWN